MRRLLIILIFVLTITTAQAQSDSTNLTFVEATFLEDINDDVRGWDSMTISPDGSTIAWVSGRTFLFLYDTTEKLTSFHAIPTEARISFDVVLNWSPDSRYLTFTEDLFVRLMDSDIWLVDVESKSFTNLTNDGYYGSLIGRGSENALADYLPTWHPITNDIYFFRSVPNEEYGRTLSLLRIPYNDGEFGEAQRFANLTTQQPSPFSIFNRQTFSLDGAVSISPDGSTMAALVRPQDRDMPQVVWLIDLQTGDVEELIQADDFIFMGMPEYKREQGLMLDSLAWAGNDGLIVTSSDYQYFTEYPSFSAYYITLDGEASPLFDFSDSTGPASFFEITEEGFSGLFDHSSISVISPVDNSFIYYNNDLQFTGNVGISSIPLPPRNIAPTRLTVMESDRPGRNVRPSVGFDGKMLRVLIGSYLFTFEVKE